MPIWVEWHQIDYYGNSALTLAYKQGNIDALRILCDHGVNPKFKPFPFMASAYELALAEKNREVLKIFI